MPNEGSSPLDTGITRSVQTLKANSYEGPSGVSHGGLGPGPQEGSHRKAIQEEGPMKVHPNNSSSILFLQYHFSGCPSLHGERLSVCDQKGGYTRPERTEGNGGSGRKKAVRS
jgi:hypothetical protein